MGRPLLLLAAGLAAFLLLAPTAALEENERDTVIPLDGSVVTLGESNFDTFLQGVERVLVEFYAPWCGHCKALEPEFQKAAEEMMQEKLVTKLAKVDVTEHAALGKKYDVKGYPTLLYFARDQSEPVKYEGERTAAGIKAWLSKRELPSVNVLDATAAKAYLAGEAEYDDKSPSSHVPPGAEGFRFWVVAKVVKKSARAKAYQAAAEGSLSGFETAPLRLAAVHLPKGIDPKGEEVSLTLWRPQFEEPDARRLVYKGKWTEAAIAKWIRSSLFPTVGGDFDKLYGAESVEDAGKDGMVAVILDDGAEEEEDELRLRPAVLKHLLPLAVSEPRYAFTTASLDSLGEGEKNGLGLSARGSKSTAIVVKGGKKYRLQPDGDDAILAPEGIKNLLESVKSGKARPYYKTAPVPEPEVDDTGVLVLTGETFEKHVMNSGKDVFVEFYAPWCGHCQKLMPIWGNLASKAKTDGWKDVVIAKMDMTENECEEEVSGYPKLVFYPAVAAEKKMKSKREYTGQREFEPLSEFVLNSAKTLEGFEEASNVKYTTMIDREKAKKGKVSKKEL